MTTDEFAAELAALVADARDGPAQIEGAHNVRSLRGDTPDYTVEITEIAKRMPDWLEGRFHGLIEWMLGNRGWNKRVGYRGHPSFSHSS